MEKKVLYIGLDVDDNSFLGSAGCKETGEFFNFKTKPSADHLAKELHGFIGRGFSLVVVYEATYLGFSLYRELTEKGFNCKVVAPSLIPTIPGRQVKTDRLDADKILEFLLSDLLTFVSVPEKNEEDVRNLIRTRGFLLKQKRQLQNRLSAQCRLLGLHYHLEGKTKKLWTIAHTQWLKKEIKALEKIAKFNLEQLLVSLESLNQQISSYDEMIESIAGMEKYQARVLAMGCYRGLSTLTSMTLITEIGDINRFKHPSQLMSYFGLDVREYSSGGKEKKFGITKLGNKFARKVLVEANQKSLRPIQISRALKIRRQKAQIQQIEIADRCMLRLYKKGTRLLFQGKHINKVKVALAREMVGFIWESLRAIQVQKASCH